MYRTIGDFINDWAYESASTIKMFEQLNDACLQKTYSGEVRKIATLAWHITTTPIEMLAKTGLQVAGAMEHSAPPASAAEIVAAYKAVAKSVTDLVSKNWTDTALGDKVSMYGQEWEKGKILSVLIMHQTHHRGQLTVLMRLDGLKVPGVYGPAKEEWAMMGMPAME